MDPDQLASNPENPPDEIASGDVLPTAAPETHEAERESGETGGESVSEPELAKATDEQRPILQSLSGWGFGSGFSWGKVMESGGSLMQTVKRQTEAVVDVYRKDINDLVQVVSSETSHVAERLEKLKPVMASTTGTVVENLKNIVFEDSDEEDEEPTELEKAIEERVGRLANSASKAAHDVSARLTNLLNQAVKIKGADDDKKKSKKLIYDPKLAMIAALRADPSTFLEDPREPNAPPHEYNPDEKVDTKSPLLQRAEVRFQTFRTEFNMAEHAGQISRILNEDLEMKRMLERIVPAQASYEQFWERYFFKVAEIDVQEARRKALMQGVQAADEDDFAWDDEDSPSVGAAAADKEADQVSEAEEGDDSGSENVNKAEPPEAKIRNEAELPEPSELKHEVSKDKEVVAEDIARAEDIASPDDSAAAEDVAATANVAATEEVAAAENVAATEDVGEAEDVAAAKPSSSPSALEPSQVDFFKETIPAAAEGEGMEPISAEAPSDAARVSDAALVSDRAPVSDGAPLSHAEPVSDAAPASNEVEPSAMAAEEEGGWIVEDDPAPTTEEPRRSRSASPAKAILAAAEEAKDEEAENDWGWDS